MHIPRHMALGQHKMNDWPGLQTFKDLSGEVWVFWVASEFIASFLSAQARGALRLISNDFILRPVFYSSGGSFYMLHLSVWWSQSGKDSLLILFQHPAWKSCCAKAAGGCWTWDKNHKKMNMCLGRPDLERSKHTALAETLDLPWRLSEWNGDYKPLIILNKEAFLLALSLGWWGLEVGSSTLSWSHLISQLTTQIYQIYQALMHYTTKACPKPACPPSPLLTSPSGGSQGLWKLALTPLRATPHTPWPLQPMPCAARPTIQPWPTAHAQLIQLVTPQFFSSSPSI